MSAAFGPQLLQNSMPWPVAGVAAAAAEGPGMDLHSSTYPQWTPAEQTATLGIGSFSEDRNIVI